jgi:hypothetical protein
MGPHHPRVSLMLRVVVEGALKIKQECKPDC